MGREMQKEVDHLLKYEKQNHYRRHWDRWYCQSSGCDGYFQKKAEAEHHVITITSRCPDLSKMTTSSAKSRFKS